MNKLILLGIMGAGVAALAFRSKGRPPPSSGLGDVDGDNLVTVKDAELVTQYNAGIVQLTQEQLVRADVNCDGKVSIVDALFIAQYAEGIRTSFPCEEP